MPGGSAHRSQEETKAAIAALGQAGMTRLHRVAQKLTWDGVMGREDLIQESFCRVLSGSRPWPANVDLMPFLVWVMRSVASAERRKRKGLGGEDASAKPPLSLHDASGALVIDPEDPRPNIEDVLMADALKQEVLGLFKDDTVAEFLAEGIMDGMQGEELRKAADLEPTPFASKRRLINRRIEKHFSRRTSP